MNTLRVNHDNFFHDWHTNYHSPLSFQAASAIPGEATLTVIQGKAMSLVIPSTSEGIWFKTITRSSQPLRDLWMTKKRDNHAFFRHD